MVKGLWTTVNGEPFMENPHLGILNSRKRKRGGRKMARRRGGKKWGRSHMSWVRSFKKRGNRRRYRRNSYPLAGVVANRRRRRYRRNPGGGAGTSIMGFRLPPLQSVLYTGGGLIGAPIVEGFLTRYMPVELSSNVVGKYAVRIASVLGLSWIAKAVLGREAARMVGIGGGAYVVIQAVREFAPGVIPGMAAYATMGSYAPMGRLMASGMGAPAWGARQTVDSAGGGAANIVPGRFRRFQ